MTSSTAVLIETAQAIDDLDWLLEDDGEFESSGGLRKAPDPLNELSHRA